MQRNRLDAMLAAADPLERSNLQTAALSPAATATTSRSCSICSTECRPAAAGSVAPTPTTDADRRPRLRPR
jgi:hypothetical protein